MFQTIEAEHKREDVLRTIKVREGTRPWRAMQAYSEEPLTVPTSTNELGQRVEQIKQASRTLVTLCGLPIETIALTDSKPGLVWECGVFNNRGIYDINALLLKHADYLPLTLGALVGSLNTESLSVYTRPVDKYANHLVELERLPADGYLLKCDSRMRDKYSRFLEQVLRKTRLTKTFLTVYAYLRAPWLLYTSKRVDLHLWELIHRNDVGGEGYEGEDTFNDFLDSLLRSKTSEVMPTEQLQRVPQLTEVKLRLNQSFDAKQSIPNEPDACCEAVTQVRTSPNSARFSDSLLDELQQSNYRGLKLSPEIPNQLTGKLSRRQVYRCGYSPRVFSMLRETPQDSDSQELDLILLVDESGSTRGDLERWIQRTVNLVYHGFEVLCEGRLRVFGFTSDPEDNTLLDYYDSNRDGPPRGALLTRARGSNRDGVFIDYVGEQFDSAEGRKVLVVWSDGCPAGMGYFGEPAMTHTRRVIKTLEEAGVLVIGVNLDDSPIEELYTNHLDCSDNIADFPRRFTAFLDDLTNV